MNGCRVSVILGDDEIVPIFAHTGEFGGFVVYPAGWFNPDACVVVDPDRLESWPPARPLLDLQRDNGPVGSGSADPVEVGYFYASGHVPRRYWSLSDMAVAAGTCHAAGDVWIAEVRLEDPGEPASYSRPLAQMVGAVGGGFSPYWVGYEPERLRVYSSANPWDFGRDFF